MSAKRISYFKVVSGKSLVRKESCVVNENKVRSSSAEAAKKISLKNVIIRKSKENLIPKDKLLGNFRGNLGKLQKLDLNVKEVNNSFYRRLCELEPKIGEFEGGFKGTDDVISPVKSRY